LTPSSWFFDSGNQAAPNANTTTWPRSESDVTVSPSIDRNEKSEGRFCAGVAAMTIVAIKTNAAPITVLRVLLAIQFLPGRAFFPVANPW